MRLSSEQLRAELLRRAAHDSEVRRRLRTGEPVGPGEDGIDVDIHNTAWLRSVTDDVGWPGRSLVGDEGAHAAWLLAQHADRDLDFQQRCQQLMAVASAAGEASAADLAALTDRVLVNCGVRQMYGTQLQACDGGLAALPLVDPDAVDARRASVGLEPLAAYVARVVERDGAPPPARIACPRCGGETEWWPPAPGGTTTVICPTCAMRLTISGHRPGAGIPAGSRRLSI